MARVILDVRTKEEWDTGHVKGARLLPLDELLAGKFTDLKHSDEIYTYCRSGSRSALATQILTQNGFDNVHNAGSVQTASAEFGSITRGD